MIKYENHCCGCAVPGYPCMGGSCPNINVPVHYCDFCKHSICDGYDIEGDHYCEDCAVEYLREIFENLTPLEQSKVLKVDMKRLED